MFISPYLFYIIFGIYLSFSVSSLTPSLGLTLLPSLLRQNDVPLHSFFLSLSPPGRSHGDNFHPIQLRYQNTVAVPAHDRHRITRRGALQFLRAAVVDRDVSRGAPPDFGGSQHPQLGRMRHRREARQVRFTVIDASVLGSHIDDFQGSVEVGDGCVCRALDQRLDAAFAMKPEDLEILEWSTEEGKGG